MAENINISKEEYDSLKEQISLFRDFFRIEATNRYGLFYNGNAKLEFPELDSFAKYKYFVNIITEAKINDYNKKQVKKKLIDVLLTNEEYLKKELLDVDAESAIEFFGKDSWLSKKNQAVLARHMIIDNDTYLEHLTELSPYFGTLKKNNPDLKDSSIKLMNEVMGAKTKKSATKQEKLERHSGMLWAYKDYTPQEISDYSDSFDWYRIRRLPEANEEEIKAFVTKFGLIKHHNEEFLNYINDGGEGLLRNATLTENRYRLPSRNNLVDDTMGFFSKLYDTNFFAYYGKLPINHVLGYLDAHFKTIIDNSFMKLYDSIYNGCYGKETMLSEYFIDLLSHRHEPAIFRNFLIYDHNYDVSLDDMRTIFRFFVYLSKIMTLKVKVGLNRTSFQISQCTVGEALERAKALPYYEKKSAVSKVANAIDRKELEGLSDEVDIQTDKIFEYYKKLKEHENTVKYICSEKYWTEFNSCKNFGSDRYNNPDIRIINPIRSKEENIYSFMLTIPEVWEDLYRRVCEI